MPLERWSDNVVVVHLADEPQFTEDLESVSNSGNGGKPLDCVLDFAAVHFVNSSNISQLLRLRKQMINADRRLVLCNISNQVWGTFLVTGLDKIFTLSDNVTTALATIQMAPKV